MAGPASTSSISAASSTVQASGPLVASPAQCSPTSGPAGTRPRAGLKPTTPQQLAGMRSEPPPSPPSASGQSAAAMAAAPPPLEPPVVRSEFQGLRAGGKRPNSVVARSPNSGVLVLPSSTV